MTEGLDLAGPLVTSRDAMGLEVPMAPKFKQAPLSLSPMKRASVDGDKFITPGNIL